MTSSRWAQVVRSEQNLALQFSTDTLAIRKLPSVIALASLVHSRRKAASTCHAPPSLGTLATLREARSGEDAPALKSVLFVINVMARRNKSMRVRLLLALLIAVTRRTLERG